MTTRQEPQSSTRVHFMGNAHVQRAACGRYIGPATDTAWTANEAEVTCFGCRKVTAR